MLHWVSRRLGLPGQLEDVGVRLAAGVVVTGADNDQDLFLSVPELEVLQTLSQSVYCSACSVTR
jgi:hypothetical protein